MVIFGSLWHNSTKSRPLNSPGFLCGWQRYTHDGEDGVFGVLGDDDVHVRVPSPPGVPGGATGL